MSQFLSLREWLDINDAMRYLRQLGMVEGQSDFLPAYVEADLPMRLACRHRDDFFTFAPENPEMGYPHCLRAQRLGNGEFHEERGRLSPAYGDLIVASIERQKEYNPTTTIWVNDPLSFDLKHPDVEPIYYHYDHEGDDRFNLLSWDDLMRDWAKGILQFSRPHIEELVKLALGKKSDAPAQASVPASYTTRLLQIQSEAIRKWWINYDPAEPDTAPDKSAIIDWLTAEKGCTQQAAEAIDQIIRHDSRKKGGAKPRA